MIAGSPSPDGIQVNIDEVHRFDNAPVLHADGLYHWDFEMLSRQMLEGLAKAAAKYTDIVSIGIDTWGVDFGLVGSDGVPDAAPLCYRNSVWESMMSRLADTVGPQRLYERSGLQPIGFNSIYRLMWMLDNGMDFSGKKLLFMPDMFNYLLTGRMANEYTIASTSGLLDARTRTWDVTLMRRLGIEESLMCNVVMPGQEIGRITDRVARLTGLSPDVRVMAVGSHDTASAVNAIATDPSTAFLSSGTWSLLGIELPEPVTSPEALASGYSNEGGTRGITFLQNITGLWILQQLVAQWKAEGQPSGYSTLVQLATDAATDAVIDVDDPIFASPGAMREKIETFCLDHGCPVPASQGEMVRCVLQSLARRYARGLKELEAVTGCEVRRLHVIGGGSRNALLNSLTAQATGVELLSGPAEATAFGNIKTQISHDNE